MTRASSIFNGYREVFTSLCKQKIDPEYAHRKELPKNTQPYWEEFYELHIARLSA